MQVDGPVLDIEEEKKRLQAHPGGEQKVEETLKDSFSAKTD